MRCFTISQAREGLSPLFTRGCVQFVGTDALTCQAAANSQATSSCVLCEGNQCNSSAIHLISITTILAAFFVALKSWY